MELTTYSFALEDVFGWLVSGCSATGFFLDIGAGHGRRGSNSRMLEELGWNGVCVDVGSHRGWEDRRPCVQADARQLDWEPLLTNAPRTIDFVSVDIDEFSTEALLSLPWSTREFASIAIEHDQYLRGEDLREPQREFLSRDYTLVSADIYCQAGKPFEDWWVKTSRMTPELESAKSAGLRDIEAIRRFGKRHAITRQHCFEGESPRVEVT